jgi:ATP-dependent helicase/nuclease subunit B
MEHKTPNIYTISAYNDFFEELVHGILHNLPSTCNLKDVIILLPTKRACFSLGKIFYQQKKSLPKIHSISDLSELVQIPVKALDKIALTTKILLYLKSKQINLNKATELAEYLSDLIVKTDSYKIDLNKISQAINEESTLHQQEIFQLLQQFIQNWEKTPNLSKAAYNNLLIEHLIKSLSEQTVIIAGVHSNLPAINELMDKVIHMQNGYLILYGLDEHLNHNEWKNIDITHHQYNFKNLYNKFDSKPWLSNNNENNFISEALKPANSCYNWHQYQPSLQKISYINCHDHHHEAKAIIDIIKNNLHKTIMIVTPDDSLMVKLMLHLRSNNIDSDIIRDHPLKSSPTGIWLQLCLNFISDNFSLLSGLSLLKHPFANIDQETLTELELIIREKSFNKNNIIHALPESELLETIISQTKLFKAHNNFNDLLVAHMNFAESISKNSLWEEEEAGKELKEYLDQLLEHSSSLGYIRHDDYCLLFNHFLKSAYYRPANMLKNITLSKPIDARLHKADLMILAGLNETIWPTKPKIDPCFNNNLLIELGLPKTEQSIGEEAYDFYCLAQAKELILTRSEKIDGTATLESRWLLRILTLNQNIPHLTYNAKEITYDPIKANASPTPPLDARPNKLSATQIDKLIFNPYHIYVDLILKLKKLPSLNKDLSALDFGNFIHKALEIYSKKQTSPNLDELIKAGKQALAILGISQPQIQLLWWPRFIRIAKWCTKDQNSPGKIYLESSGRLEINNSFTLIAIADRIETNSNQISIIDYKTGRLSSIKSIYNGKNLQLIIEGIIATHGGFNFQNKINSYSLAKLSYIQLSGGESPAEELNLDIENKPILFQAEQYIHSLINQYKNPLTPYYYTNQKSNYYCEYAHLAKQIY